MVEYTLDANDIVVDIGGEWDEFARANRGEDVVRVRVLGRPIFDFITGSEVQQLYRSIFAKVRQKRRSLSLTFRCDAPKFRRLMACTIAPERRDCVRIEVKLISEEPREPQPILDRDMQRDRSLVVICCICGDIKSEGGDWVGVELESSRCGWLESNLVPQLSHAYCPACFEKELRSMCE